MNKLLSNAHLGLFAATLAIVLAALTTGCDSAQAKSTGSTTPRQQPNTKPSQETKYFGDQFAKEQQALNDKPAAQMPQAF